MVDKAPLLVINKKMWLELMDELKKRGDGKKESGAFLLGAPESNQVAEYICYDELDPECLTGMIEFGSIGFSKLWQYCRDKKLSVLADVHTHPYGWTGQSRIDKQNPMICLRGHIALIVPYYAQKTPQFLSGVGVFEYLGNYKWKIHKTNVLKIRK